MSSTHEGLQVHNNGPWGNAYTDREMGHLRKEMESHIQLLTQRLDLEKRALDLQAEEYERRLAELNHAHEMAREALALTVSRDKFDQYAKAQDERQGISKRALLASGIAIAGMVLNLALYLLGWLRTP